MKGKVANAITNYVFAVSDYTDSDKFRDSQLNDYGASYRDKNMEEMGCRAYFAVFDRTRTHKERVEETERILTDIRDYWDNLGTRRLHINGKSYIARCERAVEEAKLNVCDSVFFHQFVELLNLEKLPDCFQPVMKSLEKL